MSLILPDEDAYRTHYLENFTRRPLTLRLATGTAPVYFRGDRFDHAFFESTQRDGVKNEFSLARAQRMDDIPVALEDLSLVRRAGWDKKTGYHHTRCATVCIDDFVVVLRFGLNQQGYLKGMFVTCYVADQSINKIRCSPAWDETLCLQELSRRKT